MRTVIGVLDDGFPKSLIHSKNCLAHRDFGSLRCSHGDLVSKAIMSIDPECEMILAEVNLDSWEKVLDGLRWISSQKIDCLNLSWACRTIPEEASLILRSLEENDIPVFCSFSRDLPYPWTICHQIGGEKGICAPESIPGLARTGTSIAAGIVSGSYSLWRKTSNVKGVEDFLSSWNPEEVFFFPNMEKTHSQRNLSL